MEHVHERHHGAGHAQARVRVDVVREKTGFDELGAGVAFGDGLLAAQPEGQARLVVLPRLFELGGHEVESFVPARLAQTFAGALRGLVLADHRRGQAVVAVHDLRQVVAFDAVETLVGLVVRVACHADQLVVLDLADDAATAAAEAAHRRVLLSVARSGGRRLAFAACASHERRHGACRRRARQRYCRGLDESSS